MSYITWFDPTLANEVRALADEAVAVAARTVERLEALADTSSDEAIDLQVFCVQAITLQDELVDAFKAYEANPLLREDVERAAADLREHLSTFDVLV